MLELVVLGHVAPEGICEHLDVACSSQLTDEALSVLDQLFLFDFLIGIHSVDLLFEELNRIKSFESLKFLIVSQILQQLIGSQITKLVLEYIAFISEELVNYRLAFHSLEYVGCKSHDHIKRLVEKVALESELELRDVFSRDSFVVEFVKFLSDQKRVNHDELNWEKHLAVTMELLQHLGVAVFQAVEQNLNLFEDILLWFTRIDPLCQLVEQLLLEQLSVFFPSQVCVDLADSSGVRVAQTFFHWAAVEIDIEHSCKIGQLPGQSDDECTFQIYFSQLLTFGDLHWNFTQRVIIQPESLQIGQVADLGTQLDNIVVTQIKSDKVFHFENL